MNKKTIKVVRRFAKKLETENWFLERGLVDEESFFSAVDRHYESFRAYIGGMLQYDELTAREYMWLGEAGRTIFYGYKYREPMSAELCDMMEGR